MIGAVLDRPAVAESSTPHPAMIDTERFAPITLDELVRRAGLMTRVDRKYLIPLEIAADITGSMDAATQVLEIDSRRTFGYDSVYFDTAEDLAYRLTAQRRRRRFKVRVRSYLDTGLAFLEVKTKSGRGATIKERIEYDLADRTTLTSLGRDFVHGVLQRQGHDRALVAQLEPTLLSRYQRTTLLLPEGARATIDTRLHWATMHTAPASAWPAMPGPERHIELPAAAIIETKSAGAASALDRALWRIGYRPSSISKFGTGTAALRPELPHNKWSRPLRDTFSARIFTKEVTL